MKAQPVGNMLNVVSLDICSIARIGNGENKTNERGSSDGTCVSFSPISSDVRLIAAWNNNNTAVDKETKQRKRERERERNKSLVNLKWQPVMWLHPYTQERERECATQQQRETERVLGWKNSISLISSVRVRYIDPKRFAVTHNK